MMGQSESVHPGGVILLVDDHTDSRIAMAQLLRQEKLTVLEASSGDEALQIFDERDDINLLISDMKMPGMDGLELMDRLMRRKKTIDRLHPLKSIALTAYPNEYTESDTAIYSFDEYIEKAGEFDDFLRVVRELLY